MLWKEIGHCFYRVPRLNLSEMYEQGGIVIVSTLKKVTVMCMAVFAIAAVLAVPASAETLRFSEGGQPIASGKLSGGEEHGAIHCQAVSDVLGSGSKAPGSVVITGNGKYVLGAPRGGECEVIYEIFAG